MFLRSLAPVLNHPGWDIPGLCTVFRVVFRAKTSRVTDNHAVQRAPGWQQYIAVQTSDEHNNYILLEHYWRCSHEQL